MSLRYHAVLLAVLCLQGLPPPATARARGGLQLGLQEGDGCTCAGRTAGMELLRGQGALADCEAGLYCACASRVVARCPALLGSQFLLDEVEQMCGPDADCASQLASGTSGAPSTAATTSATLPATCECGLSPGPGQQLLRGADALAQCEAGAYCDCAARAVRQCGGTMRFSEDSLQCDLYVDCDAALSTPPAETSTAAAQCACTSPSPARQLIRGADELALCEDGQFCDCASGRVERCPFGPFDEDGQQCSMPTPAYDCRAHLDPSGTTTAPAPATRASTASPSPECASCDAQGRRRQLVRGADQLQRCRAGDYCDCESGLLEHCFTGLVFDEAQQTCAYSEDDYCADVFDPRPRTSAAAPTLAPSTSAAGSTTSAAGRRCVCRRGGHELQLLRGADEEAACLAGYFCDCQARSVQRCPPTLGVDWMFDEDKQMCNYEFDCRGYMKGHPVPSGGDQPGGGDAEVATSGALGWTDQPVFWYRLASVAIIVILVNLGVIYGIQYYCRGQSETSPGRRLLHGVPWVCPKQQPSQKKSTQRESVA